MNEESQERGVEVNLALKLWCEKHEKCFEGTNPVYVGNAMMQALMDKALDGVDIKGPGDISKVLHEIAAGGKPMCCMIGQDALDQILADAPASSGDHHEDLASAAHAIPGIEPYDPEKEQNEEVKAMLAKIDKELSGKKKQGG